MNLLRAELAKLVTLPAAWFFLLAAGCGTALGWRSVSIYAVAAIAAQAAGSEYRGGQVRLTLVAAPRRGRLFAAKFAAAVGGAGLAAVLAHPSAPGVWLVGVLLAGVGAGLATVARGALVPLAGFGLAAVAARAGLLPAWRRLLPDDAMTDVLAGRRGGLIVLVGWAALSAVAGALLFARRDG